MSAPNKAEPVSVTTANDFQDYFTRLIQQAVTTYLAQEQIEYVRTLDYDSLTVGTFEASHALGNGSADRLSQYSRSTTVGYVNGSWNTSATDTGLKKVDVNVTWTERSGTRQYSLTTYVYDK